MERSGRNGGHERMRLERRERESREGSRERGEAAVGVGGRIRRSWVSCSVVCGGEMWCVCDGVVGLCFD